MTNVTLQPHTAAPMDITLPSPEDVAGSIGDFFAGLVREPTPTEQLARYRALSAMYLAQNNVGMYVVFKTKADQLARQIAESGGTGSSTSGADQARAAEHARRDAYWAQPGVAQPDGSIRREGPTPRGGAYSIERPSSVTGARAEYVELDATGSMVALFYGTPEGR